MNSKNVNGEISLSKGVYKDIVSIIMDKKDCFYPAKKENKYIDVDFDGSDLIITLHIRIKQGVDVVAKCSELQNEIYETIYQMIGIEFKKIHIDIVGFER